MRGRRGLCAEIGTDENVYIWGEEAWHSVCVWGTSLLKLGCGEERGCGRQAHTRCAHGETLPDWGKEGWWVCASPFPFYPGTHTIPLLPSSLVGWVGGFIFHWMNWRGGGCGHVREGKIYTNP